MRHILFASGDTFNSSHTIYLSDILTVSRARVLSYVSNNSFYPYNNKVTSVSARGYATVLAADPADLPDAVGAAAAAAGSERDCAVAVTRRICCPAAR